MLRARIITAIVVLALFLPAVFLLSDPAWVLFAAAVVAVAAWEWANLGRLPAAGVYGYSGVILIISYLLFSHPESRIVAYACSAVFWVAVAPVLLRIHPDVHAPRWLLPVGIAVLPAVFMALIEIREHDRGGLLIVMAVVWISDTMAYFTGRTFGSRKLAPTISPGKTWEGVAGGLAGVLCYAAVCFVLGWSGLPGIWTTIVVWLALAALGIIGDLIESLIKRSAGVKDSGRILPGHGGILDRVDALLPVLPLAALVQKIT